MANVKRIHIEGEAPFNFYGGHPEVEKVLAQLNHPVMGIRIIWLGRGKVVPNEHGGRTSYERFIIQGEEAVRWEWADWVEKTFKDAGAEITQKDVIDLEA